MIDYLITGIVTLLAIAGLFFIDNALARVFGWLFRKVGLQSGNGPLLVRSKVQGEQLLLSLENQGKDALKLAAVEGRDGNQKKCYPAPYLEAQDFRAGHEERVRFKQFAGIILARAEVRIVILDQDELVALGCRSLAVLGQRGNKWPIPGFGPDKGNITPS